MKTLLWSAAAALMFCAFVGGQVLALRQDHAGFFLLTLIAAVAAGMACVGLLHRGVNRRKDQNPTPYIHVLWPVFAASHIIVAFFAFLGAALVFQGYGEEALFFSSSPEIAIGMGLCYILLAAQQIWQWRRSMHATPA